MATEHRDWHERMAALEILGDEYAENAEAQRAIAAATHDAVDWVAFTAIKIAGERRLSIALKDLIRISGWPSNFTQPGYARKPVGCGAALTKRAMLQILGSRDPDELRALEDEHFAYMRQELERKKRAPDLRDAVYVPAGPFIAGTDADDVGPFQMRVSDNPLRVVDLPAFFIDRTAVTNARYAEFLTDGGASHAYCHPDEPQDKDHAPAHLWDPRFNAPDLPVVGVDWYDAWGFCAWAGGRLPSELEWEKAARGRDGRVYPWGDEWDPRRANFVDRAFEREVRTLEELESVLVDVSLQYPSRPVLPADSLPEGASPYGAIHMAGNVWEMTRTNFFSGEDMDPFFSGRNIVDFMNRRDATHVLRGGTWTSPAICTATFFRGKDLLTDRHNEVGFRCAYPTDESRGSQ